MALNKASLKSALQASIAGYPASPTVAAQGWADAIAAHVGEGMSPQGVPPTPASVTAGKSALASSIATAFQAGSAAGAGAAVGAAVALFYQGLLFTGATPGTVTGVPGAAALSPALSAAFSDNAANSATMAQSADSFANAIHACTQTVIVTHVAPSFVVGPLT
jgi:hypothetical protein